MIAQNKIRSYGKVAKNRMEDKRIEALVDLDVSVLSRFLVTAPQRPP